MIASPNLSREPSFSLTIVTHKLAREPPPNTIETQRSEAEPLSPGSPRRRPLLRRRWHAPATRRSQNTNDFRGIFPTLLRIEPGGRRPGLNSVSPAAACRFKPMLFGQYLIYVGVLKAEDVLAALDEQEARIDKFGKIAVRMRLITPARLLAVLDDQIVHRRRVGETAIALGYLTEEDVRKVLLDQKQQRRPIGALLVDRGALTEAQLRKHLADYFANPPPDSAVDRPTPTQVVR